MQVKTPASATVLYWVMQVKTPASAAVLYLVMQVKTPASAAVLYLEMQIITPVPELVYFSPAILPIPHKPHLQPLDAVAGVITCNTSIVN